MGEGAALWGFGLLWLACSGEQTPPVDPVDPADTVETADTPAPVDTPPGDTVDTVPVDTVPPDTDEDTDVADTDLPVVVDTWRGVVAGPTPDLTGGFTPVAGSALAADPVYVSPGDRNGGPPPSLTVAWLADLDEDGAAELIVSAHHSAPVAPDAVRARAYDLDAALHPTPDLAGSAALAALGDTLGGLVDLDDDGHVDAILDRLHYGIAWGVGPNQFGPAEAVLSQAVRDTWRASTGYALVDVDRDGWLDLLLAERSCTEPRVATALIRTGPHRLEPDWDVFVPGNDALVWTVFPLEPEPGVDLLAVPAGPCDSVNAHLGFYERSETADGRPRYTETDPLPQDAVFRFDPAVAGGPITKVEPMGGTLTDVDADGLGDVALALDSRWLEVFRWRAGAFVDHRWAMPQPIYGVNGDPMFAWGLAAIDVDRDRLPDLVFATGDDVSSWQRDGIGPAHPMLWRNTGRMAFEDLTAGSGLEIWGGWRGLAVADPDGDGDADLFVGGNGNLPELLRNDVVLGHGISLRLRGTTSNHFGVGARVRLIDGAGPAPLYVMGGAGSPELVAEPWLFLGLGDQTTADLEIVWPSGLVQQVRGLAADRAWTLREPETLTVSPATRRVVADGVSTVTFSVQPRAVDGAVDPSAVAEIRLYAGAGTWAGPTERDGDGWSRTLIAPASAGTAVVEATIQGVALDVRPRVWFDAPR